MDKLIENAIYNIVPIVGNTYHLYHNQGRNILSIIEPHEWNLEHLGSYKYVGDNTWEKQ